MKAIFANWKTTAAGLASVLTALGLLARQASQDEWDFDQVGVALGMLSAGVAGLMARDADKTSEQSGAK